MKTVLLVALFSVGYVFAQVGQGCGGLNDPNTQGYPFPPPDYGSWGACGQDQVDGGSCNIACDDNGPGFVWTIAGPAYTCTNGVWGGGPQSCQYANYVSGKKNCTVPPWYWYQNTYSGCTSNCGGTQTQTRTPYSLGESGGEPCPSLTWIYNCGQMYCTDTILTQGYYKWGPFCADSTSSRTVNYRFITDEAIDMYVFDQADYTRYTWDASIINPLNAYYSPAYAHLNTQYQVDSFTVPAGQCYYMVLDDTNVGPTKTQQNQVPGIPDTFNVHFSFSGINTADGFSDFQNQLGVFQPASASKISLTLLSAFLVAFTLFLVN